MPMKETQFMEDVAHQSDLIIFGKIIDYSDLPTGSAAGSWTKIEAVEQVFSKQDGPPREITVRGWQAKAYPLFAYEKGDFLLLFLERRGSDFVLTNDSWKNCVPSVWNAKADKSVYRNVSLTGQGSQGWVPLREIVDSLAQ